MSIGIAVKNVTKSFDGKTVLSDLTLSFERGTVTCIRGPSGCGKTTLLRILAGLETPDAGIVERGEGSLAYVFQEDRLSENFSAVSNIRLVTGKRLPAGVILEHLKEVGLGDDVHKPVREYSGGMKRRVAIARAVCCDADFLLMDEPFKGLDAKLKTGVMEYVKRHSEGKTVIYVTHDASEAAFMGGTILDLGERK